MNGYLFPLCWGIGLVILAPFVGWFVRVIADWSGNRAHKRFLESQKTRATGTVGVTLHPSS